MSQIKDVVMKFKTNVGVSAIGNLNQDTYIVDQVIEGLLEWFDRRFGSAPIVFARERFFAETGTVFPEDALYSYRMAYFVDYFLFRRPVTPVNSPKEVSTAFGLALKESVVSLINESFSGAYHSIFEVLKSDSGHLRLRDLFAKRPLDVRSRPGDSLRWIGKADLLQTHLYVFGDDVYMGDGVICHPKSARRSIVSAYRKISNSDEAISSFMSQIAQLSLRLTRHNGLSPKVLYAGLEK